MFSSQSVGGKLAELAGLADYFDGLDLAGFTATEIVQLATRIHACARRVNVIEHDIAREVGNRDAADLGGPAARVLANNLRITPAEARRRLARVQPLSQTSTLTGQTLPPRQPRTAALWRAGTLEEAHVDVITTFLHRLPSCVNEDQRRQAEQVLADHATAMRPDELAKLADKYTDVLNPDGDFNDHDRARRRGFTWGPQQPDGMSKATLWANPELRAGLEAFFAKYANYGMANPDQPTINSTPTQDAINTDLRSRAQRQHDALALLVRSQLGNPQLGLHNGLPVTIIASTTIDQLHHATGWAHTAGGTRLPITDLIKMASHAIHYLAIFDNAEDRPLYFGRTRRVATSDQRLLLMSTQRGCTFPGCTTPGVRHEALVDRVEVRDLHRGSVAAGLRS